jgi:hypothetical protein
MAQPPAPPAAADESEENLYPIAVLIDELRNEDVQVYAGAYISIEPGLKN